MAHELTVREQGWLQSLRDKVMGVFDGWFGGKEPASSPRRADLAWPGAVGAFPFGPAVDVVDEVDAIRVAAELPGLGADDFKVEVDSGRLFLRGEKRAHREGRRNGVYLSESRYGSFSRVVPLPCDVKTEEAQAVFKDGVLEVRLPKTEEAKARRIQVRVE